MSYTTLTFFIFIAVVFSLYYFFPRKYQWIILLIASYFFYFYACVKYAFFIIFSTACTFFSAQKIESIGAELKKVIGERKETLSREEKKKLKSQYKNKQKRVVVLTLVINFGILVFLKYYNFAADNINKLLNFSGLSLPTFRLFLPLGISFYTFQAMGYIIDIYRGDIKAETNLGKFALFISFFPQIIQGPIDRYDHLAHQLSEPHELTWRNFKYGCELMIWGYFKKMVIADRFLIYVTTLMDKFGEMNGTAFAISMCIYAVQIYADFSGGIDISRGFAQTLGIDMAHNFRQPYFATSLSDYWNRWHISLGAWMKTYVFYPIALSNTMGKAGKSIKESRFGETNYGKYISSVIPGVVGSFFVFLLVGIWHGAEWRYVIFGVYNAGIISISMLLKPGFDKINSALHISSESVVLYVFRILRTFAIVAISNITDMITETKDFFVAVRKLFTEQAFSSGLHQVTYALEKSILEYGFCFLCVMALFIVGVYKEKHANAMLREVIDSKCCIVEWLLVFFCLLTIIIFGIYGPGYDPADFVYMQF